MKHRPKILINHVYKHIPIIESEQKVEARKSVQRETILHEAEHMVNEGIA
jgi:hypothetical protein